MPPICYNNFCNSAQSYRFRQSRYGADWRGDAVGQRAGIRPCLLATADESASPAWYNRSVTTGIDIKAIPPPLRFDAHGVCQVADTRVTLLTLIEAFLEGATPEEIYQEYPTVSLAGVYTVIVFYLGNRDKIDGYLHTVREREARVVEEIKLRSPLSEIRRRLLPRKTQPA